MKRTIFSLFAIVLLCNTLLAQKYFTRDGQISFSSDAALEKIEANNNKATCVLDTQTGKMEFAVLIKGFEFEKALMQEHFNENYMESGEYPKALFKGEILNNDKVNYTKEGEYPVTVKGQLTIHGVTNEVEVPGTITVKDGVISAHSKFEAEVADYKIEIPKVVRDNIAKTVVIDVQAKLEEFKKKS